MGIHSKIWLPFIDIVHYIVTLAYLNYTTYTCTMLFTIGEFSKCLQCFYVSLFYSVHGKELQKVQQ